MPKFPYHGCLQTKCRLVISISQCNAIFCGFRLQIPIRAKFCPTQRANCQTEFPAVGSALRNMSTPSAKTSNFLVKMCKAQFAHPGYVFGTQLWSSLLAVWLSGSYLATSTLMVGKQQVSEALIFIPSLTRLTAKEQFSDFFLLVAGGGTASRYGGWLRIYLISSRGQQRRGGPPAWGLDEMLTTRHRTCYETVSKASDSDCSFGTTQVLEKGCEIRYLER